MSNYVKSISVTGLYGRFDLDLEFYPGVNVLYGKNGSGKTTLLHILANALNGDYERFAYLHFNSINIELDDGVAFVIRPQNLIDHIENPPSPRPTAYFPAFRSMIEAWGSVASLDDHLNPDAQRTDFSRNLFGKFVPRLNYPSIIDLQKMIRGHIQNVFGLLTKKERQKLSIAEGVREKIQAYDEIMIKMLENESAVLSQVNKTLDPYLAQVNRFLSGKQAILHLLPLEEYLFQGRGIMISHNGIVIDEKTPLKLKFDGDGHYEALNALSSGERQIMTMLYATSRMSQSEVILIDEPEISFHVDWQRLLLREMSKQLTSRQIIVCTHSPIIWANHVGRTMELTPSATPIKFENKNKVYVENVLPRMDHDLRLRGGLNSYLM